jgi:hypothetical protein
MDFAQSESARAVTAALSNETSLCVAPGICLNLLQQLFLSYGLTAIFGIVIGVMGVYLWRCTTYPMSQSGRRDGS